MADYQFPSGFLWGSATSAHQVEGNNIHSDWWAWEQAGRVTEPSGLACDHYRRFTDDFDLAASLGHTAHRFSLEWSRIEPVEGQFDETVLAHYREVITALRDRRLEPIVTLHHFTNPQWFLESGGWVDARSVDRYARYVERVAVALGSQVRYWVTINEPMVYVNMHYIDGEGPPGDHDLRKASRVIEHLIRAHAAGYRILHETLSEPQVSLAKNMPVFLPCRRWFPPDVGVTWLTDRIFNGALLEAVSEGRWSVPGMGRRSIPEARGSLDYLGVNFYGRQFVRWAPQSGSWLGRTCDLGHHSREVTERSDIGWDVCPEAFTQTLLRAGRLGLPILVMENGTAMDDDARRWSFLARHLGAMADAMDQGTRILGYCYWSLLDNFEWAKGFGPRFGLIEVDHATQKRTVRETGRKYAQVCKTNTLRSEDIK